VHDYLVAVPTLTYLSYLSTTTVTWLTWLVVVGSFLFLRAAVEFYLENRHNKNHFLIYVTGKLYQVKAFVIIQLLEKILHILFERSISLQ